MKSIGKSIFGAGGYGLVLFLICVSLALPGVSVAQVIVFKDGAGGSTSNRLMIDEGGSGKFEVKLSEAPGGDVMALIENGSTALTTASSVTFTISNWDTYQEVTVTAGHDDDADDNEFGMNFTGDYGGGSRVEARYITVTDDDEAGNIILTPATGTLDVDEGGTGTFEVHLDEEPLSTQTLAVAKTKAGFTVSPSTLTFTASNHDTKQMVTVTGSQDNDHQDIEDTITLSVSSEESKKYIAGDVTKAVKIDDDDTGGITLGSAAVTITEGGSAGSFTVVLDTAPATGVDAVLSVVSGDTGAATVSPATLTFDDSNYETAQMVTVTPEHDNDGTDESVTITIDVTSGYPDVSAAMKQVTIQDDDGEIEVSAAAVEITEGGTAGTFEVTLAHPPKTSVTLNVASGDSGAATVSPTTLTFNTSDKPYDTAQTVTVTPVQDTDGLDESVGITLAVSSAGGYRASDATKTIAVEDDDRSIVLSSAAVSSTEGGSAGTFTVALETAPAVGDDATISVSSGDTAVATVSPATLTFTSSNYGTAQTVTVTPVQDADGLDGTVTITVSSDSNYEADAETKGISVIDDDRSIILTDASALTEGSGSTGTFDVTLETAPASGVDAMLSVTSGDTGLTFNASDYDTPKTVTLTPKDDADGTDESVTIIFAATSGYATSDATKSIAVNDDDGAIDISSAAVTIIEGGSAGRFTVELGAPPASSATLSVTSADTGAVTVSPATLTFTASDYDTAQPVTVTPVQDADGADESANITVAATGGSGYTDLNETKSIVVEDDDATIDVSSADAIVDEGSTGRFTVNLGTDPKGSVTLSVTSSDTDVVTVSPTTLTFDASDYDTAQPVILTSVDNDEDGTDESVTITLSVTGGGYRASDETKSITVRDDDGDIEISGAAISITEGGSTGTFTVELLAPPASSAVLSVTSGDTGAVRVSPQTLTFNTSDKPYDTAQTVTVKPVGDVDGTDESVTITLAATSGYRASDETKAIAVTDDDGAIEISGDAVTITEDGSAGTFTVALAAPPVASVTLTVTSADTGAVTVSPATLTFSDTNWNTAQDVTVTPKDDPDGTDESVAIAFAVDTNGGYTASSDAKSITVIDDDGGIELEPKAIALTEGGDSDTFTVKLIAAPVSSATLSVVSSDTLSATVSPKTLTFTDSNYGTPQTVTVSPADDSDDTDDTATIILTATPDAGYTATKATKSITVADDDGGIELSPGAVGLTEGGESRDFTVALTEPPVSSATLLVVSGDTGAAQVLPETLTFTASNYDTPQRVTVSPVDDADGSDESLFITLSSTVGYLALNATKAITVVDDDGGIETSPEKVDLVEGGKAGSFTVRLAVPPVSSATFSVVSGDLGAVTVSPTTLTFTASDYETPQRVSLTPLYDPDDADETVAVTIAATAGYTAPNASESIAVRDDDSKVEVSGADFSLTEGGSVGTFTVHLASAPASNAVIEVKSDDSGAVTASPATLTFTPSDYAAPQTVTLTAVQDLDGTDETVVIAVAPALAEDRFAPASISAAVADDDGGIDISAAALTVNEGGTTGSFTVKLAAPPLSSATLSVKSADPEALTVTPATLTFAAADYDKEQEVTVAPVDDADADAENVTITLSVMDEDNYTASDATKDIAVEDDEVEGNIVFDPASTLMIDEGGSEIFTVSLDIPDDTPNDGQSPLKESATVSLSSDSEYLRLFPTTLAFEPSNYASSSSPIRMGMT
ncbi:MAG: hypothetical protein ISN28_10790 [Ectothiorhodospiraceae bacterium AqS1]|nr:hypothetical protein [Ectothiorhodospiraceae bacterium AqS1]